MGGWVRLPMKLPGNWWNNHPLTSHFRDLVTYINIYIYIYHYSRKNVVNNIRNKCLNGVGMRISGLLQAIRKVTSWRWADDS